jgi:DNA repair exonuclease SbcCD ATPase subunit
LAADPEPPPVVAPDPDAPLIHQLQTWNLSPTASCHDCETAIAHLETLRDQLQHPEPHHGTINGHIQTAQKRIATLTATLDQWRDRLSQAQTLADIRTLQAGVQSLELAFRNSAVFPQYQALQTTIQKRHQDCDRLQTLTQTINTSQTLAQCEANRLTLQDQAGQFHHPDEFADAIAQLHQRLQDRIHKAHTALNQYQETLATLTTLHQAQAQRDELLKRSGHYQKSELEARYQHLNDETKALINLFQLYERKQQRTPQDCDDLRQQLDAWLNTVDLTETLDHHFKRLSQEIQEKRDRLHQKQEHQAREWVKSIANEMVKINTGSDLHAQSEQSQRILHNITQEQPKYLAYLTRESHETLAKIRQTCQRLIDVNTTQTIERLFQELSPPERQTLYTKLRTYL